MSEVKSRRYDSSGRRATAAARQARVLDVARELFLSEGFAATTVAAVAAGSEVSEETVYKAFGGKSGLVRALRQRALQGTGDQSAEDRSDRLRSEPDPRTIVRGWARLAMEVAPRVSPILLLVRDAAIIDPALRDLQQEMDDDRLRRMRENARALARAGHLRPGVGEARATDVLFTMTAPEMFDLLVQRQGWALRRYARFVEETICSALLRPKTGE